MRLDGFGLLVNDMGKMMQRCSAHKGSHLSRVLRTAGRQLYPRSYRTLKQVISNNQLLFIAVFLCYHNIRRCKYGYKGSII